MEGCRFCPRPAQGPLRKAAVGAPQGGFRRVTKLCKTLHTELLTLQRDIYREMHSASLTRSWAASRPGADLSAYGNLPHRALG